MIARLLLALLLAAFAVPSAAPAACHDTPTVGHAMPMPDSAPDRHALPAHACIGCIPPSEWLGARVAKPVLVPPPTPMAFAPQRLTSASPSPDLPPPRRG